MMKVGYSVSRNNRVRKEQADRFIVNTILSLSAWARKAMLTSVYLRIVLEVERS